jgi:hypothetical protein
MEGKRTKEGREICGNRGVKVDLHFRLIADIRSYRTCGRSVSFYNGREVAIGLNGLVAKLQRSFRLICVALNDV